MTRAVLDANVLFSANLRDTLLWPAFRGVYEARFSASIHEEWIRAILKHRAQTTRFTLEKTRDLMNRKIPGGLVEGFEPLIETISLPDRNDRHVLAVAIHAKAPVIVTRNTADFPASILAPYRIATQTPDEFLSALLRQSREDLLDSLRAQRANLQNPPLSMEIFLANLRNQNLPRFTAALEPFQNQL